MAFECKWKCGKHFKTVEEALRHQEDIHMPDNKYACDKCRKKFKRLREMKQHQVDIHHVKPESELTKEIKRNRVFINRNNQKHKRTKDTIKL